MEQPFELEVMSGFTGRRFGKRADELKPSKQMWAPNDKEILATLYFPEGTTLSLGIKFARKSSLGRTSGVFYYEKDKTEFKKIFGSRALPEGKHELLVELSAKLREFQEFEAVSNHKEHLFDCLKVECPYISKKMLNIVRDTMKRKIKNHLDFYFSEDVSLEIESSIVGIKNYILLHIHHPSLVDDDSYSKVQEIFRSYQGQFASNLILEEKNQRLSANKVTRSFSYMNDVQVSEYYGDFYSTFNSQARKFKGDKVISITLDDYTIGIECHPAHVVNYIRHPRYTVFTKRFGVKKAIEKVKGDFRLTHEDMTRSLSPYFEKFLGISLVAVPCDKTIQKAIDPLQLNDRLAQTFGDNVSFNWLGWHAPATDELEEQGHLIFYTHFLNLTSEKELELIILLEQMIKLSADF